MHLAGPTCSGKSAIAQDLLELEPSCVIINADSKQVYRQLFLLTDRPSPCPRHVLYGHVSVFGSQAYSVVCWLKECIESLELLWSVGKIPVVVGGTALYLRPSCAFDKQRIFDARVNVFARKRRYNIKRKIHKSSIFK